MERSRTRSLLVALAASAGLAGGGCGAGSEDAQLGDATERRALPAALVDRAEAAGLGRRVPASIAGACADLRAIASRRPDLAGPVVCPPLVPAGPARHVRRTVLPPAPGRAAPDTAGWAMEALSPGIGPAGATHGGHWRVAVHSRSGHRHLGFRPPPAAVVARTELSGVPVRVYEMPPYPAGGVDGGHVVVEWALAEAVAHVSVHGHGQRRMAELMAEGLIRATAP